MAENTEKLLHDVKITPDRADGIYFTGDTAVFKIEYFRNGKACPGQKLEAYFHNMHYPQKRKNTISFTAGEGKELSVELNVTGSTILKVFVCGKNGTPLRKKDHDGKMRYISFSCGVLASPEKCLPYMDEPADFQAFWEEQKKELAKVPVKVLEKVPLEVPEEMKGKFVAWDMKIACAGSMPVSGYLSMPSDVAEGKRKVPVVVSYHGGGVRSSVLTFRENAVWFDVNAHGIVNGKEPAFYLELSKNELNKYIYRGMESRETFYFRYMYLRVLRAQEFVKSLPQWNRKDLVLYGGSQGGGQVLVGAGLDPEVTLIHAWVPALCNLNHYRKGYSSSWPCSLYYCNETGTEDPEKVAKCIPYFDAVNFARRIRCEVFMSTGLLDTTCPPGNVFAAYNVIPSQNKTIHTFTDRGHLLASNPTFPERLEKLLSGNK